MIILPPTSASRRIALTLGPCGLAVACSVEDVKQRMQSMETQMAERFARLEHLLTAGRDAASETRAVSEEETDKLLPGDGARP